MDEATTTETLWSAENLSFPRVQVVVMNANMGCGHCRQRVSKVISKMNGFLDYMVDFHKKEVTVRGVTSTKKKRKNTNKQSPKHTEKKVPFSLGFLRLMCLTSPLIEPNV